MATSHALRSQELVASLCRAKLKPEEEVVNKGVELFECVGSRCGVLLVGDAGSGKTSTTGVLAGAMDVLSTSKNKSNANFRRVKTVFVNPKALSIEKLFGAFDAVEKAWCDGIATRLLKECVKHAREHVGDFAWLVFDGQLDISWAEQLHGLLDGASTLTLTKSEFVRTHERVRILFELCRSYNSLMERAYLLHWVGLETAQSECRKAWKPCCVGL
eukprot:6200707-Pleurochrysis_carterae.AAC.9